jgi:flagellin
MDQIGNMLTRLKELATQASSANAGTSEREKIDAEADQLIIEIDRISNSTKYGSTSLLDGTFGLSQTTDMTGGIGDDFIGTTNVAYDFDGDLAALGSVTALGSSVTEGVKYYLAVTDTGGTTVYLANSAGTTSEKAVMSTGATTIGFTNLGITIAVGEALSSGSIQTIAGAATTWVGSAVTDYVEFTRTGLTSLAATNAATGTYTIAHSSTSSIKITGPTMSETQNWTAQGSTITFADLGISFNLSSDWTRRTTTDLNGLTFTVSANANAVGSTFQIGAENNSDNRIAVTIDGTKTTDLGISALDLTTASGAQSALDSVDAAISTLAGSRGDIGAFMNRLSYAAANLASTIENVQAAESVIRDVDIASDMTNFTKNQILLQAGTAMLAQANLAPQQVLALFG